MRVTLWYMSPPHHQNQRGEPRHNKKRRGTVCLVFAAWATLLCGSLKAQTQAIESYPTADGIHGKVFSGYQGWYRTPTDGSGLGWKHYKTVAGKFTPGEVSIDYWPDTSELTDPEKYPTAFKHTDGRTAYVYTAQNKLTVDRHFKWMAEYGIDGAFLQRFASEVVGTHRQLKASNNQVLQHVQSAANHHKRAFAVMYDLSGLPYGSMHKVIDDWKELSQEQQLQKDPAYLRDEGKPVVAIWGVGFSDGRAYTLDEVKALIEFFHDDPEYGGCSVLLGVPTYWRTLNRDSVADKQLHTVLASADILLPWTVGRFSGTEAALGMEAELYGPDLTWCTERKLKYMPVIFPGFSWGNLNKHKGAQLNEIPREDGRFLWAQAVAAKRAGSDMLYIAMFDEMDEGTQIFKVSNDPPAGASQFLSYEPNAPDYYLRLSGAIGRLLRNEISTMETLPEAF